MANLRQHAQYNDVRELGSGAEQEFHVFEAKLLLVLKVAVHAAGKQIVASRTLKKHLVSCTKELGFGGRVWKRRSHAPAAAAA